MPEFESVHYTEHARRRMRQRRIPEAEVERVLRFGEGHPDQKDKWVYELDDTRVIIVESQSIARVITVVRLRGKR